MFRKLFTVIGLGLCAFVSQAQRCQLVHGDVSVSPVYGQANLFAIDTIHFTCKVQTPAPAQDTTIALTLDVSSLQQGHQLLFPNNTLKISAARWAAAISQNNTLDTFVTVAMRAFTDTSKTEDIARLFISAQPNNYVLIRISNQVAVQAAAADTGRLILNANPSRTITTFTDDMLTPKRDTIPVSFTVTGKYNPTYKILHYQLNSSAMSNHPKLTNTQLSVTPAMWNDALNNGGILQDKLYLDSYHVIDTGALASSEGAIKVLEDSQDSVRLYATSYDKFNWYKKSNFILISFIKSISGTTAQNELLDIFIKVNLRSRQDLDAKKHLWFSMIGADAGLLSDTASKGLPLNEAILSINYAMGKIDDQTNRVAFMGGGFKQFFGTGYFGAHVGILEVGSFLKSSYLFAGYYYSPYVSTVQLKDTANTPLFYRHNVYVEAAFNAFGDNVPKALQFIRLKFGLMMPMAVQDQILPDSKRFNYRLAVEVPIGGVIKF